MAAIPRITIGSAEQFKLCTFCNASTNGYEKRLFTEPQPKGPYFPILAEIKAEAPDLDELGRAVVCLACFHHLLRQWSSFERRGVPLQKRVYNLITDDRVNNFQHRREDEIRREAEKNLKDVQHREEQIRKEAEEKLKAYQEREQQIKQEAERRLCEEQRQLDEVRKEAEKKLREEQLKEERIKDQLEQRLVEEKEKGEYIRKEAERLLREEKLLERNVGQQQTVIKRFRTEVIVPEPSKGNINKNKHLAASAPELRAATSDFREINAQAEDQDNYPDMDSSQPESSLRAQRKKKMEYDPETGCYVKTAAEDTPPKLDGSDKEHSRANGRAAGKKDAPSRVSDSGSTSAKSKKATDNAKSSPKKVSLTAISSRRDSVERKRKDAERQRAQAFIRGGDASKPSSATSKPRSKSEPNLDTKLKEMEQRRARMFLHGKSEGAGKGAAKKADESKASAKADKSKTSSKGEDTKSSEDARKNKKRTREERNRRRITAEEINLRRSASEDVLSPREKEAKKADSEHDASSPTSTAPDTTTTSPSDPSTKPDEKAVKMEYVWTGKEVTRVEVPVGKSTKEKEEELSKVGLPIKGYLKKDPNDVKMSDEEPMELKVSVEEKSVKQDDPDIMPNISDVLQNLESAATGTADGRTRDDKAKESSPPTHVESLNDEPEASQRMDEPAKDSSVDLPTFGQPGDSVDGPAVQSLDDFVAETLGEFRKRADSNEGETLPNADKLVQIETAIEVNSSVEVQSAPDTELYASPVFESISAGNRSRNNGAETIDEERRRKRKEQEEKRRRIEENQQRAAMEKKLREGGMPESREDVETVVRRGKTDSESSWDAAEKRTSLRGLWEALAGPSSSGSLSNDEIGVEQVQTELRSAPNIEEFQPSPREEKEIELEEESRQMDVEETPSTPSFNGVNSEKHKLSEEELRWESAGHFQPGKLRSKFHEIAKDAPVVEKPQGKPKQQGGSHNDRAKNEAVAAEQELFVPHKLNGNLEANQTAAIDTRQSQDEPVESQPKPLWEVTVDELNHQNETMGGSDSREDDRSPRIETDEYHKLTQEELKWEGAGQFQPSKLNKSLFTEFDRPPRGGEERPKTTKHTLNKVQEIGLPSKLDHEENRGPTRVIESKYEHEDRPSVGRLQEPKSRDFEEGDELSEAEMKRRHFEEERRRIELEEIEREKENERRRREREEQEDSLEKEDFPDDEFELKVKTKAVNKIDRSLLGQFLQGDRKDEDVPRRREPQQSKQTREEPVAVIETVEVVETEPGVENSPYEDERGCNGMIAVRETDLADDEFERKVLEKKIGKINLKSSPFHGAPELVPYSSQRKNPEEGRGTASVTFDVEECVPVAESLEVVESEPVQYSPGDVQSSEEVSAANKDLDDDPFERKVQAKKIGKINLESSPFLSGKTTEEPLHDIRRKRREESRREEESKEEDGDDEDGEEYSDRFVLERTPSEGARERPTETSPVANEIEFEDDEFEMKVKKKEVKKLNLAQFEFKQRELEEKEQRLRQLEEERRKKEREEKEQLKEEEVRRRQQLQAEARARAEEDERIRQEEEESNVEVTIEDSEPKYVGKLDITKFSQFQRETMPPQKPPRISQPASEEPVIECVAVSEIRSAPDFEALENGVAEEIDYEDKRKDVGRLSKDWYFLQQQQEADEATQKAKYLEEERLRLEREEIDRSRQEERFKKNVDADEHVSDILEQDSFTSPDKPSKVGKLNLDNFSQFRQSSGPPINTQKQRVDVDRSPVAEPREVVVASANIVEVESSPYEVEFQEDAPSSPDKPKSVGRLGDSHVAMFNMSDPDASPRAQTPDASRSSQAQEVRPSTRSVSQEHEVTLLSAPADVEEEEDYEQRLKNVKKLDVDRFMQSRKDESIERQRRTKQLEEERLRREKEEMNERRVEENRRKQSTGSDRVDGGVIAKSPQQTEASSNERFVVTSKSSDDETPVQMNGDTEQGGEKLTSVGRLRFDQFSQFQQAEATKEKAKKPKEEVAHRRKERPTRYVIESNDEAQPHKDINHNDITYTHSTSRTPLKDAGDRDKPKMDDDSKAVPSNAPEEKLTPKRLSRDMFAVFESGGSKREQPAPMRRAKSEMQLNPNNVTIVDRKAWRDDDAVVESRRRKNSREQKRARPKSIAFIDTSMFEN